MGLGKFLLDDMLVFLGGSARGGTNEWQQLAISFAFFFTTASACLPAECLLNGLVFRQEQLNEGDLQVCRLLIHLHYSPPPLPLETPVVLQLAQADPHQQAETVMPSVAHVEWDSRSS